MNTITENYLAMLRREQAIQRWVRTAHAHQLKPMRGIDYEHLAKRAVRLVNTAKNQGDELLTRRLMLELDVENYLIAEVIMQLAKSCGGIK
jgi:hypothetical protein